MPGLEKVLEKIGLALLRKEWHGYKVYEDPQNPELAFLIDQDGNIGAFYANERAWNDLEDFLGLIWEDLNAGKIQWYETTDEEWLTEWIKGVQELTNESLIAWEVNKDGSDD